jgi:hypothetical protein
MHKQDDLCRVTLLLPPGKFDFQVYRNGKLASQKSHSLRSVRPPALRAVFCLCIAWNSIW